jgi:hypothetical protein
MIAVLPAGMDECRKPAVFEKTSTRFSGVMIWENTDDPQQTSTPTASIRILLVVIKVNLRIMMMVMVN